MNTSPGMPVPLRGEGVGIYYKNPLLCIRSNLPGVKYYKNSNCLLHERDFVHASGPDLQLPR